MKLPTMCDYSMLGSMLRPAIDHKRLYGDIMEKKIGNYYRRIRYIHIGDI